MTSQEIRQIVWAELNRAFSIVLTGVSANASDLAGSGPVEDIGNMVPGLPSLLQQPVAYPYGVSSRAPTGTSQVVVKGGNHPLNRIIVGHYDPSRPTIGPGESVLYNQYGQQIRMENGAIRIGSPASEQPLVLGLIFQSMMQTVLDAIAVHTHISSAPGALTSPPQNASTFSDQSASPVGDGAILSQQAFTE